MKRVTGQWCAMMFPRRRGLYLRIIVLIPVTWFLVTVFVNLNGGNNSNSSASGSNNNINHDVNNHHDEFANTIKESNARPAPEEAERPVRSERLNKRERLVREKERMRKELENAAVIPPPKDSSGYGEMGKPVQLTNVSAEIQRKIDKGWESNAFNQYISDLISLRRSLPDVRDPQCKKVHYQSELPDTSVIICFHNEAWSVLLRTVHSVLDRSPKHLIKEIILVDDFSDQPHLGKQLEDYVQQFGNVKVVRAKKREGLIRARLLGASAATGKVLTYLDSHCECTEGWLEPLLDRIATDPTTVVCPVIDVINDKTFEYHYRGEAGAVNVGGFDWNLQFNWHSVPEREKKRRKHPTDAVWSPTMAGGLFSIDKQFFEKLGTYDNGFDIWGGENLELSFKTWMCGGTLEIVPCSHVGHVFRSRSPYKVCHPLEVAHKSIDICRRMHCIRDWFTY